MNKYIITILFLFFIKLTVGQEQFHDIIQDFKTVSYTLLPGNCEFETAFDIYGCVLDSDNIWINHETEIVRDKFDSISNSGIKRIEKFFLQRTENCNDNGTNFLKVQQWTIESINQAKSLKYKTHY